MKERKRRKLEIFAETHTKEPDVSVSEQTDDKDKDMSCQTVIDGNYLRAMDSEINALRQENETLRKNCEKNDRMFSPKDLKTTMRKLRT
ncbi:hypothetical protein DPMN_108655 [Dreissena polymorpha]|uniref:Uncharacterized protein n=1 Tax=Dreissena polymorpha TaxID=45954 RepID=A0A9D4QLF0_DREPO|nr:hypothetical protein DPMN_108655 [Dreissena polymorpha]